MNLVEENKALCQEAERLCQFLEAVVASSMDWKDKFDLVFSDKVSGSFHAVMRKLGVSFTWCDPDADYEDDVCAFVNAAVSRAREVIAHFDAIALSVEA